MKYRITNEPYVQPQSVIRQRLRDDAKAICPAGSIDRTGPLTAIAEDGEVFAGAAFAYMSLGGCQLENIWVEPDYRHQGVGSVLLAKVEMAAYEKEANVVWLHRFGFHALGFYEKRGYECFAELTIDKHGSKLVFYRKYLRPQDIKWSVLL